MSIAYTNQIFTEELYRVKPLNTVVILTKAWQDLKHEEKDQLQKISDAIKQRINPRLSIDAFHIIHQPKLELSQLTNQPKAVIYFGSPIKGLNYYELIEANQVKMVLSESLVDLITNEQSRQKLWKALQQLFAV